MPSMSSMIRHIGLCLGILNSCAFTCPNRLNRHDVQRASSSRTSLLFSATPDTKELARQLHRENIIHVGHDYESTGGSVGSSVAHHGYDQDIISPLELEFQSLMATFLTYTERDIRSLTSTSSRYIQYATKDVEINNNVRSKEVGIRYRALFEGVQR